MEFKEELGKILTNKEGKISETSWIYPLTKTKELIN